MGCQCKCKLVDESDVNQFLEIQAAVPYIKINKILIIRLAYAYDDLYHHFSNQIFMYIRSKYINTDLLTNEMY